MEQPVKPKLIVNLLLKEIQFKRNLSFVNQRLMHQLLVAIIQEIAIAVQRTKPVQNLL